MEVTEREKDCLAQSRRHGTTGGEMGRASHKQIWPGLTLILGQRRQDFPTVLGNPCPLDPSLTRDEAP